MLRRILVAVDHDRENAVATRYALAAGERFGAEITGIAVETPQLANAALGADGDGGVVHYDEKPRARNGSRRAHAVLAAYDYASSEPGIRHVEHTSDRVPYRRIAEETKYHDMLVIGREPWRSCANPGRKAHALARIVKRGISPTLVVPEEFRHVQSVLVAYDASEPAARTMQKFAQLQPFGTQLEVDIVHVRGWVGEHFTRRSEHRLSQAADYFAAHGFETVATTSLELAEPQERLLEYAREREADLIVAGAHSVSAMQRIAFGSTTHALLEKCPVPFFLFH